MQENAADVITMVKRMNWFFASNLIGVMHYLLVFRVGVKHSRVVDSRSTRYSLFLVRISEFVQLQLYSGPVNQKRTPDPLMSVECTNKKGKSCYL